MLMENKAQVQTQRQASHKSVLRKAILNGMHELIPEVLRRGNFDSIPCEDLECAVRLASEPVIQMYIDAGANTSDTKDRLNKVLFKASAFGTLRVLQLALDKGADIEAKHAEGHTALLEAVNHGNSTAVRLLLSRGASKSVKDCNNYGLLQVAAASVEIFDKRLSIISKYPDYEAVVEPESRTVTSGQDFMDHYRRIVDQEPDLAGMTDCVEFIEALHEDQEHESIIQQLLEHGSDITVCTEDRESILHLAVVSEHRVRCLLDKGKDDLNVNIPDRNGRTPLHYAAGVGNPRVMQVLLDYGAELMARDSTGATILHLAVDSPQAVEFALGKGIDVNERDNSGRTVLHYAALRDVHRNPGLMELLQHAGIKAHTKDCHGNEAAIYARAGAFDVIYFPPHIHSRDFENTSELLEHLAGRYPLQKQVIDRYIWDSKAQADKDNIRINAKMAEISGMGHKWWIEEDPE